MFPGLLLTVANRLFKDIMGSELPFGGKPVLFAGDFRQILPVVRRGTRSDIVMSSINTVRLSFVMTINKSQRQTFNKVVLLLRAPVFTHG
ncbi:ATP-dependent DNA helicase PIF1-like [Aphis craccivora]|uniref:ATP-dependent DNA helicase n=1 Tax=Aphis craccivora TaxID=307492 RepID=A0A6G0Y2T7_APHCR|nr:ATP-dependent DNA helicase PIF1-like [Aphis craccivora]